MRIIKRILRTIVALPVAALVFLFAAAVLLTLAPLVVVKIIIEWYERFVEIVTGSLEAINNMLLENIHGGNN